jgi:hypothetical protein
VLLIRVADPHNFNVDSYSGTIFINADPDPGLYQKGWESATTALLV